MISAHKDIAVVIPARNEAGRIGGCLAALRGQMPGRVQVILVINNTTDGTAAQARAAYRGRDGALSIIEMELPPGQGVGAARAAGARAALEGMPALKFLLNTDADCETAPDWVARNAAHLRRHDAVCGRILPIEREQPLLSDMDPVLAAQEGRYRALVLAFYARHAPERTPLGHADASGASLAVSAAAYSAVGGFAALSCGEDRDIVRRLRRQNFRVAHPEDVWARASLRLSGRAPGGMAHALRARTGGQGYTMDECLPPAAWLWQRRADLPEWPHDGSGYDPVPVTHAAAEIARLEGYLARGAGALQFCPPAPPDPVFDAAQGKKAAM